MSNPELDSEHYFRKVESVLPGQHEEKTVLISRSLHKSHDPGLYYDLATVLFRKEDFHGAMKKYRLAITIYPEFSLAYNAWGACLCHLRMYDEAIFKFRKALDIDPGDGIATLNWGLILFWLNQKAEAEKIVEERMKENLEDQETIVEAFETELFADEKRLEAANTEEEKEYLKGRIAGYHWVLESVQKFFENEAQNSWEQDGDLENGGLNDWEEDQEEKMN